MQERIVFVCEGFVGALYFNEDENEKTGRFTGKNESKQDCPAFLTGSPSV